MKADVSKPGTSTGPQVIDWVAFPGGELEGRRPDALCAACRRLRRERTGRDAAVCFQCYRERHRRERLFREASQRETTSEAQFQWTLPFEPVNTRRLESLKALRATERGGVTSFVDRRRRAPRLDCHRDAVLATAVRHPPRPGSATRRPCPGALLRPGCGRERRPSSRRATRRGP